ncbi:MAG TPA: hypothetical protein VMV37_08795 [Gammaproteobacteria bacterium]|nr:hypothetical protein [Gammaproteobacteria bacterium]
MRPVERAGENVYTLANLPAFCSTVHMSSTNHGFLNQPRTNEVRVIERDGRRFLQQWRMPAHAHYHDRAWVDVAELPWPPSNVRPLRQGKTRR